MFDSLLPLSQKTTFKAPSCQQINFHPDSPRKPKPQLFRNQKITEVEKTPELCGTVGEFNL